MLRGGSATHMQCLHEALSKLGVTLNQQHYGLVAECWRAVSAVVAEGGGERAAFSKAQLEDQVLSLVDDRLRTGRLSHSRVKKVVQLLLASPSFRRSDGPSDAEPLFVLNVRNLQGFLAAHDIHLKATLEKETGIPLTKPHWDAFLRACKERQEKLQDQLPGLPETQLTTFRTKWCSRASPHDPQLCPDAHREINSGWLRRNPYAFEYQAKMCQDLKNCASEALCSFAHSPEELNYHPDLFKTRRCANGVSCDTAAVCPFVHTGVPTPRSSPSAPITATAHPPSALPPPPAAASTERPAAALLMPRPLTPQPTPSYKPAFSFEPLTTQSPSPPPISPSSSTSAFRRVQSGSRPYTPTSLSPTSAVSPSSQFHLSLYHRPQRSPSSSNVLRQASPRSAQQNVSVSSLITPPKLAQPHVAHGAAHKLQLLHPVSPHQHQQQQQQISPRAEGPQATLAPLLQNPPVPKRAARRPGLPRLLSELRRFGMDILTTPSSATMDFVLLTVYGFFNENATAGPLTHREITYRLYYRLQSYGTSQPGIEAVSRTKLRGVLALLKTIGCFVCSKESDESLTTMTVRDDLSSFSKFRELYDLGLLAYASHSNIVLSREDLEQLLSPSTRAKTGIEVLLPSQWSGVLKEYERRLAPEQPFWKSLDQKQASGSTSGSPPQGSPTDSSGGGTAQHQQSHQSDVLGRSIKAFIKVAQASSVFQPTCTDETVSTPSGLTLLVFGGRCGAGSASCVSNNGNEAAEENDAREYKREVLPLLEKVADRTERDQLSSLFECALMVGAKTSVTRSLLGFKPPPPPPIGSRSNSSSSMASFESAFPSSRACLSPERVTPGSPPPSPSSSSSSSSPMTTPTKPPPALLPPPGLASPETELPPFEAPGLKCYSNRDPHEDFGKLLLGFQLTSVSKKTSPNAIEAKHGGVKEKAQ